MPQAHLPARAAALEMIRRGAHGLSVTGAYASDVDRRGAHAAAENELMKRFNVRRETARSALGWAMAQARGEPYHSGRKPGSTSGTRSNRAFTLPPDVLKKLDSLPPGRRTAYVVAAIREKVKAGE